MSQAAITIGSKVRVTRVRDRIPADLVAALQADASATVTDFKVTDGKNGGAVFTQFHHWSSSGEPGSPPLMLVARKAGPSAR